MSAEQTERCERYEREGLLALERDRALEQHHAECVNCRESSAEHDRLKQELRVAHVFHDGRTDWQARVWAEIARRSESRRPSWRWAWLAAPVAVLGAVLLVLFARSDAPPGGQVEIALRHELHRSSDAPVRRSGHAQRGDELVVRAVAEGPHVELRVYRDDRHLVARCGDTPRCQTVAGELSLALTLDRLGSRYQPVLLVSSSALPAPVGDLDRDTAAAREQGATVRLSEPIDVR